MKDKLFKWHKRQLNSISNDFLIRLNPWSIVSNANMHNRVILSDLFLPVKVILKIRFCVPLIKPWNFNEKFLIMTKEPSNIGKIRLGE